MLKIALLLTVLTLTFSCSDDDMLASYHRKDDEVFDTMAKLEALRGVDTFIGNLNIQGNDITSLSDLSLLRTIKGSLQIQLADELESLEGLNNLRDVEGIDIFHNDRLSNIDALSGISQTDYIKFKTNPMITSLDGLGQIEAESVLISFLPQLTTIGDNITISNNTGNNIYVASCDKLTSIEFLDDLQSAASVWLSNNPLLEVPNAFTNLESMDHFYLENCPKITSVDLSAVTYIEYAKILDNSSLQDIYIGGDSPFSFQDFITPEVDINNNGSLTRIEGFNGLTKASILIYANPLLERVSGFNNVAQVSILMRDNPVLNELNIFNNVSVEVSQLDFVGNTSLNDFCGLNNALNGLDNAAYQVADNLYNPTKEMLSTGACASD